MPLLKIGNRYINTDLISEWNVLESDGKHVLTLYAVMGASTARFTKDAEIDALLRWLDANATDIMATTDPQPAPVETPILVDLKPSPVEDEFTPPVERKFKDGDEPYVTNGKRSRFGERIVVVGYTLDDYVLDVAGNTYRESELEPAD